MKRWPWLCVAALGLAGCLLPGTKIVDSLDGDSAGAGTGGDPDTVHIGSAGKAATNAGASGKAGANPSSGGDAGQETSAAGSSSGGTSSAGAPAGGNTAAGAAAGGAATAGSGSGGAPVGTAGAGGTSVGGTSVGGAGAGGAPAGGAGSGGTGGNSSLSAGCGKTLPTQLTTGAWSLMADQDATGGKPAPVVVPCTVDPNGQAIPACVNGFKNRGYSVFVKAGFDNSKPSKVIFNGSGCADTSATHGSTTGYPYQTVDSGSAVQVIHVGIEYSRNDNCYDNLNPASNDFQFFPILHKLIEDQFCVNKDLEYFAGYSSGSWLANQMTCAFPDVLHAVAESTGSEPTSQPTCAISNHAIASFFLHDINDTFNTYSSALPACTRALKQNKCTVTTCTPSDTTTTTVWTPTVGPSYPNNLSCVQFNGCPAAAPVVFCTTNISTNPPLGAAYIGAAWPPSLLWDFMNRY